MPQGESHAADDAGVLVLAHGGTARWNQTIEAVVAQAGLDRPTAVAFGMGMSAHEVRALQRAVRKLEHAGVQRIVAVPLLISSASQVMRQLEYLLGHREVGSWEQRPVTVRVPVVMAAPLDADPVVAEVLLERAQVLSHQAQDETVVLVAHGPTSDADDEQWLAVLEQTAAQIREQGGFREVTAVTMRDDAPPAVQAHAQRRMRDVVRQASLLGRVLVVPVLIAGGGIEQKIPRHLHGLEYAFDGAGLLPHPKLAQWIVERVEQALEAEAAAESVAPGGRL